MQRHHVIPDSDTRREIERHAHIDMYGLFPWVSTASSVTVTVFFSLASTSGASIVYRNMLSEAKDLSKRKQTRASVKPV
jgi:hypothetical protein